MRPSWPRVVVALLLMAMASLPLQATANKKTQPRTTVRPKRNVRPQTNIFKSLVKPHKALRFTRQKRSQKVDQKTRQKSRSTQKSRPIKTTLDPKTSKTNQRPRTFSQQTVLQLYNDIAPNEKRHHEKMSEYQKLFDKAVRHNDVDMMTKALEHRVAASDALIKAWKEQALLLGDLAKKTKKDERGKLFKRLSSNARAAASDLKLEVDAYREDIRARAKKELEQENGNTNRPQLGWREANERFDKLFKKGKYRDAFEILHNDLKQQAEGNPERLATYDRKYEKMVRAQGKIYDATLTEQLYGDMNPRYVAKRLRIKAEATENRSTSNDKKRSKLDKVKSFIDRTWKKLQLVRWKRRLHQAARRNLDEAISSGDLNADIDLLSAIEDGGGYRQFIRKLVEPYVAEIRKIKREGEEIGATREEIRQQVRAVREKFSETKKEIRSFLDGSSFTQARRVLQNLDAMDRKDYKTNRGTRSFVNQQIKRFFTWVVGSPLRSIHNADHKLLKRAAVLAKQGTDGQLRAKMLLMTAKHIDASERYQNKLNKKVNYVVRKLAHVVKTAIKEGDYIAVEEAYKLYAFYGMDSKLNDWKVEPQTTKRYKRALTKATRNYIDMLTTQAQWILLNPHEAMGMRPPYTIQDAIVMNRRAEERAKEFGADYPGELPRRLRNRIKTNNLLADPYSWKGKLARFVRSNANPLNWPYRVIKGVVMFPYRMLVHQPIAAPVDPDLIARVMNKVARAEQGYGGNEYDAMLQDMLTRQQGHEDDDRSMTTGPANYKPGGAVGGGNAGGGMMTR